MIDLIVLNLTCPGLSTYTPSWVKMDEKRFPRASLRKAGGVLQTAEVISLFAGETVTADSKAFSTLMRHLKEIDAQHNTVIMVQVENESGLLGDSRDGSAAAEKAFQQDVPSELIQFFNNDWDNLHTDLKTTLSSHFKQQDQSTGAWEQVFGKGPRTDELFMAYNYAKYVERVAAAGKAEYPLPFYVNVWQNYADEDSDNNWPVVAGGGGVPGDYPSGGAVRNVFDIWMHFAPNLDFIAPDVYLNDYAVSCAAYRHRGQPLFIPEQRRDEYGARRIWTAYATYQALGVAPFGIDTLEPETSPFTKQYKLLEEVQEIVLQAQRTRNAAQGFFFDEWEEGAAEPQYIFKKGGFEVLIQRSFVFGKPGPGGGMIVHTGGEGKTATFLLIGCGFQAVFKSLSSKSHFTGILSMSEKKVVNKDTGELKTVRKLGGDETRSGVSAIMPNANPDYGGFPICVTVPAETMIAEVVAYCLEH